MKHLQADKLATLDKFWSDWGLQASLPKQRRTRLRLYMVYLLIRYGGLRLGEALSIDDQRDFVFSQALVRIGSNREVQLPEQAMTALLRLVEDPDLEEVRGHITHMDPGYVRKNFYLLAEECGIGRNLGGPRVLRHSRGVELLENNVPITIVQKFLGLQTPTQAVQLKQFKDSEAKQIVHAHLRRETLRHISARNAFAGNIVRITESNNMVEVVLSMLSGLEVCAIISIESMHSLALRKGQTVTATVKAPWVILSPVGTQTSCANNFPATVLFIKKGELEASVRLRLDDGTGMAALMAMEAVTRLGLTEGVRCMVSFSAMSVVLGPS